MRDVKAAAKHQGVTINDMITSCLSTSVKTYFNNKGDMKTQSLNIMIPANIRFKPFATVEEVKLDNKFAGVPLQIPLYNDLNEALKGIPELTSKIKKAFSEVYATYFAMKMALSFLPYFVNNMYLNFSANSFTLAFSNMPGLLKPIAIFGSHHQKMTSYIQSPSNCGMTISCISYIDYFKITIVTDTAIMQDPHSLVQLLEENLLKCYP